MEIEEVPRGGWVLRLGDLGGMAGKRWGSETVRV